MLERRTVYGRNEVKSPLESDCDCMSTPCPNEQGPSPVVDLEPCLSNLSISQLPIVLSYSNTISYLKQIDI